MSISKTTRISRTVRGASAIALGLSLALAVPLAAHAHVGVSPEAITADESAVVTFSFTHGCDGSPTTGVRVSMPQGLASVSPTASAEWDVAVERGADGLVTAVMYSAVAPVPNELRGAVTLAVRAGEEISGPLAFPVEQTCVEGSIGWTEVAADGQDPHSLEAPAPVISVHAAAKDAAEDDHHGAPSDDQRDQPEEANGVSPLPTLLGAGGLLAGVSALVVAVFAIRRAG